MGDVEHFVINRFVHACKCEGDSETLAGHENEGTLLIRSLQFRFFFGWMEAKTVYHQTRQNLNQQKHQILNHHKQNKHH